jgi:hypothetical protein
LQLLSIFENGGGATKKIQLNGKKAKNVERFSKRESKFMFFKRIQITSEKNKYHSNSSHTFIIIIKISNTDENHKKQRIILQNYKITLHHAFTTTNTITQIIIKEKNNKNKSKMQRRKRNRN